MAESVSITPTQNKFEELNTTIENKLTSEQKNKLSELYEKNKKGEIHWSISEKNKFLGELKTQFNQNPKAEEILQLIQKEIDNELSESMFNKAAKKYEINFSKEKFAEAQNTVADTWAEKTKNLKPEQKIKLQNNVVDLLGIAYTDEEHSIFENVSDRSQLFDKVVTKEEADKIAKFIETEAVNFEKDNQKKIARTNSQKTNPFEDSETEPQKSALGKAKDKLEELGNNFKEIWAEFKKGNSKAAFGKIFELFMSDTFWSANKESVKKFSIFGLGVGEMIYNIVEEAKKNETRETLPETTEKQAKKHTEKLKSKFNIDETTLNALKNKTANEIFADNLNAKKFIRKNNLTIKEAKLKQLIAFTKDKFEYEKNNDSTKTFDQILFSEKVKTALEEETN